MEVAERSLNFLLIYLIQCYYMWSTGCLFCDIVWLILGGVGLYMLRQYIKGAQFSEAVRADGKVCVITGANSGIGRALTEMLNKRGAKVYMMCRDQKRAAEARSELIARGCQGARLILVFADLSDFSTIQKAAKQIQKEEPTIDILVNNAGLMAIPKFAKTVDGFEKTWQSNYLGHFLLVELLLPQLKSSQEGRIVNVSSMVHPKADSVDFEVVNDPTKYGVWQPYYRSKMAQVMHCRTLAKIANEEGWNIKVNSCHPGAINTNILSSSGFAWINKVFAPIFWYFFKAEEDGAQTSLHLALSQQLKGNGNYYSDCRIAKIGKMAQNDDICYDLYRTSKVTVDKWLDLNN